MYNINTTILFTIKQIIRRKGMRILHMYEGSTIRLLSAVYPDYKWLPWKFENCPRNYWNDINNQKNYLEWVAKELNYKNMEDWYNISNKVSQYIVSIK